VGREQHVEGVISYSKRRASAVFQPEIMNPNSEVTYYMSLRKKGSGGSKNGLLG
jgi:hypothetical protein